MLPIPRNYRKEVKISDSIISDSIVILKNNKVSFCRSETMENL